MILALKATSIRWMAAKRIWRNALGHGVFKSRIGLEPMRLLVGLHRAKIGSKTEITDLAQCLFRLGFICND